MTWLERCAERLCDWSRTSSGRRGELWQADEMVGGSASQVVMVAVIKPFLSSLRALGGHHGMRQLALAKLDQRTAGGPSQRRTRAQTASKSVAVGVSRD